MWFFKIIIIIIIIIIIKQTNCIIITSGGNRNTFTVNSSRHIFETKLLINQKEIINHQNHKMIWILITQS